MNILHLSSNSLPDIRIERQALLAKVQGNEVYFAGPPSRDRLIRKLHLNGCLSFNDVREFPLSEIDKILCGAPGFGPPERLLSMVRDLARKWHIDVIHAHNVYAANLASKTGIPMVFDDHELMSKKFENIIKYFYNINYLRRLGPEFLPLSFLSFSLRIIEKELAELFPVIVTCSQMKQYYIDKYSSDQCIVIPNFPISEETNSIAVNSIPFSANNVLYNFIGSKNEVFRPYPHRDPRKMIKYFVPDSTHSIRQRKLTIIGVSNLNINGIQVVSRMPHMELYNAIQKTSFGIVCYEKNNWHKFANNNRTFIYLHAGRPVCLSSSFEGTLEFLGKVNGIHSIKNKVFQQDIENAENVLLDNGPAYAYKIKEDAEKHLLMDNYDKEMIKIYEKANSRTR